MIKVASNGHTETLCAIIINYYSKPAWKTRAIYVFNIAGNIQTVDQVNYRFH